MSYFRNVKSFEELKNRFRELARKNHPDAGGDPEVMKAINQEYDQLFPIWKHLHNATASAPTTETAESTRSEFYTQNGWKGSKHDWNRSTKEVAAIIRAYVKEIYPTYKFSVRFSSASMCSEIHVELVNAPSEIYKQFEELTEGERVWVWQRAEHNSWVRPFGCLDDEHVEILKKAYEDHPFLKRYTEAVQAMIDDIDREVKSYNYEDCDGMIDYFHVDFYYFGVKISDKFKIVPKAARIRNTQEKNSPKTFTENPGNQDVVQALPKNVGEYDIQKTQHTKTGETIFTVRFIRKLDREEYLQIRKFIKSIGGYYSMYVRAFVFSDDPTDKLAVALGNSSC